MGERSKRLPAWLLGLIIAVFVFAVALVVIWAMGYGDDPVIESLVRLAP